MFETAILVLLYNKEMIESKTLNSLILSEIQYSNAKLVVWNNGPKKLKDYKFDTFVHLGYEVSVEETLHNESLAVIYNRFLSECQAEKYILLDDDSVLNSSYILASSECKSTAVGMPIISFHGKIEAPKIDDVPYSVTLGGGLNVKQKVVTIGSGLVIGTDIVSELKNNYNDIFDERFYLYGVDTTFCLRLFNIKLTDKIKVISGFEHSLSRLETESPKISKFRKLERSYDLGLQQRYYAPFPSAVFTIFKVSASCIKRFFFRQQCSIDVFSLLNAFVFGRHYRFSDSSLLSSVSKKTI